MKWFVKLMSLIVLAMGCLGTAARAWDVEYDASTGLLPTQASPAWNEQGSGGASVLNGALHIDAGGEAFYSSESGSWDAGVPVTMEAQVSVSSDAGDWACLFVDTNSASVPLWIYPDYIQTEDRYRPGGFVLRRLHHIPNNTHGLRRRWRSLCVGRQPACPVVGAPMVQHA